jgi:hypothetical protein
MLDEIVDLPRRGHLAGHGKFRAGEESLELAEKHGVRFRFQQGDDIPGKSGARRGIGVGRSVQTPIRGENLAGFLLLAEHDEGEHQIVAPVNRQWVCFAKKPRRGLRELSINWLSFDGSALFAQLVAMFIPPSQRLGMLRTEDMLVDGQRAPHQGLGLRQPGDG